MNLEALTKWVGNIPDDVVRDMADIAPMLSVLGYDPYANPPDYGKADSWVKDNTLKVRATHTLSHSTVDFHSKTLPFQVKENEKLWENKAKEILNRDKHEESSNNDDGDSINNENYPREAADNNDHEKT